MSDDNRSISFHIVPRKGLEEAKKRLQELGFEKLQASPGGQRIRLSAPRQMIERILELSLKPRQRRIQIGPARQSVTNFQLPENIKLPKKLKDIVGKVIFPRSPDYH